MTTYSQRKIDFVTIFYRDDAVLMRIQAKSFNNFVDATSVGKIILIYNDDEESLDLDRRHSLISLYGKHAERVEFINRSALISEVRPEVGGWRVQQILKLMSVRFCTSESVVILDSKNHFVKHVSSSDFFTADGDPKNFLSLKYDQQRKWLMASLRYFGNQISVADTEVPPTITPYAVEANTLRELSLEIEKRSGSIVDLLSDPNFGGTEFYLIFSFLLWKNNGLKQATFQPGIVPATIFATWPESFDAFDKILRRVENGESLTFGLHSRRKRLLSKNEWERICAIWNKAGIFDSEVFNFYQNRVVDAEI